MKKSPALVPILILLVSLLNTAMGRREAQYDEEARQAEREAKRSMKETVKRENPAKQFAGGVKQAALEGPAEFVSETADSTMEEPPVVGTLEGARRGSEKLLDKTVKGVAKVATLGYGEVDNYQVIEPEKGSEEPTKIKSKIPGT